MKKRLQKIIAGVLIGIMLTSGAAFAKQMSERIDVLYNNIKIIFDGVEYTPTDVNGNTVEPFIYKGTTYLPVRAIANAFNNEVDWDAENYTIILNSKDSDYKNKMPHAGNANIVSPEPSKPSVPNKLTSIDVLYNNIKIVIDGAEYTPKDVNGNTVEPFIYKGTTYLPIRAIANAFDKDVDWNSENYTVILNSNISKELDVNNGSVISPEASESSVPIALNSKEDIYALSRVLATDYARDKYYSVNPSLSLEDDVSRFKIPAGLTTDAEKIAYLQKASYRLENDVDVVLTQEYGTTAWDPNAFIGIGSSNYPFKGKFNGNNKTISLSSNKGLSTMYNSVDYIGFFSQISDAEISNTNIVISSDITAIKSATPNHMFAMGALVGYTDQSNISNCSVTYKKADFGLAYSEETFTDCAHVGGLVGRSCHTVYNNCKVNLENSKIFVTANKTSQPSGFGGVSVGGLLGFAVAGSDNKTELGRLGVELYNCSVVSNNSTQQDVVVASIEGGSECAVGGIVGCAFNNLLMKNCSTTITKGNIAANISEDKASSTLGSAVGGIIGRMEHTGQLVGCKVTGSYLNITSSGPDNNHVIGGIAGNAYGPIHRGFTPILDCHFSGSGTSTIGLEIDATNIKEASHSVGVAGIAGLGAYQMYDCSVKDVLIINHSKGIQKDSRVGNFAAVWMANVASNALFTPEPSEIGRCTAFGVTFDISDNVLINNLGN